MNDYRIRIEKEEDERCQKMLELFAAFTARREGLCVVRTDDYGYVVLLDVAHGAFQSNLICRNAKELYRELMRIWELDYLFDTGIRNGSSDFDESEERMTPRQQEYREKVRRYYKKRADWIMSGKKEE